MSTTLNRDYPADFKAAAGFVAGEITGLKMKNTNNGNRNVAMITSGEDVEMEDLDVPNPTASIKANNGKLKQLKRKLKAAQAKLKDKKATKKNTAKKYTKSNPGAFIPVEEWRKLTDEQRDAARNARQAAGIPTRKVGSVATVLKKPECQVDEELPKISNDLQKLKITKTAAKVPASLLQAPKRGLVTTQREALYATKAPATTAPRQVGFSNAVRVRKIPMEGQK